jgi:hypothetical protein
MLVQKNAQKVVLIIALIKSQRTNQCQEVSVVTNLDLILVHTAREEVALNQFLFQVLLPLHRFISKIYRNHSFSIHIDKKHLNSIIFSSNNNNNNLFFIRNISRNSYFCFFDLFKLNFVLFKK